jgi:rhamnosyltransferase
VLNEKVSITVCIPVFNGMDNLGELIKALREQESVSLEIIAIDSTSTDGSWEYLNSQSDVVSKQISTQDFSHGGTRQILAELASNEIIIFLTQDATPNGSLFAYTHANLHKTMGDRVGAVLGSQHPRKNSAAAIAQRVQRTFRGLGPASGIVVYRNDELMQRLYGAQPLSFLSDVNVSYKKSLLTGKVPFRNVPYAEDQFMARDLLANAFDIVYSPQANVLHTNDIQVRDYAKRIEDELVGVYNSLGIPLERRKFIELVLSFLTSLKHDYSYIWKNSRSSGLKWAVREIIHSPGYEIQSHRGYLNALRRVKQ